jgi:acyl carrier protein
MNTNAGRVRGFIEENFLFRGGLSSLSDGESLIESGIMDSTGILELVAFLEMEFGITMADADIVPENLDSVMAICTYVDRKLQQDLAA